MPDPSRTRRHRRRRPPSGRRRTSPLVAGLVLLLLTACSGEAPLPGDPLRLVTPSLPDPILSENYQHDLTPSGGLRPYTFTLEEGRLPPGIALQGGTLIGTPTDTGRYEFTVSVSDANLSSTYQSYRLTVRDVPVPRLDLAVPETEIRGDTRIRARVLDARRLRAVRVWIDWEDPSVRLSGAAVRSSRDDVAVFHSEREGGVAIDVAVLGEPFSGDGELFRLELTTDEALVLAADVRTEFLYAGRHAFAEQRLGQPPEDDRANEDGAADDEAPPIDDPGDADGKEAEQEDPPEGPQ